MTIEKILNVISKRTLFDTFANEFNRIDLEYKLIILASLNYYNLLDKTIKEYKIYNRDRQYLIDEIKNSLLFYYEKLTSETKKLILSKKDEKEVLKELKKELKKNIEVNFSIDKYIQSYLDKNEKIFKEQKSFFKIDLSRDISEEIKKRDDKEQMPFAEKYFGLYDFLSNILLPNYYKKNYMTFPIEMGMNYQIEYLVKHYLENDNLCKQDYENAIKYAFRILYFNEQPYHKFFIARMNFTNEKEISELYKNNEIAILFDTKKDYEDYEKLKNNEMPKQQYVQRWKLIKQELENKDIIVIASYKNLGYKFGVIPKGSKSIKTGSDKAFLLKYKFQKSKVIDIDQNPTVQTIIPSNVTISPINKKNYKLRKEFYDMRVKLPYYEFDDNSYEILVNEWLRSKYAPNKYQIKFNLLKVGGNKKDIDIYALTKNNEKLIVQVSNTNSKNTIKKKIDRLSNYNNFLKLFFFDINSDEESENIFSLKRVINDFKQDNEYSKLLEKI